MHPSVLGHTVEGIRVHRLMLATWQQLAIHSPEVPSTNSFGLKLAFHEELILHLK